MDRARLGSGLRIIWTIAVKDIVDAIKSKTTITMIVAAAMMVLTSQALPLLMNASGMLNVAVYDPGNSRLTEALAASDQVRLQRLDSQEELEALLTSTSVRTMGLVVPADFDEVLASGQTPRLEGYVLWSNRTAAQKLKANLEQRASDLLGQPVRINVEGNVIYPPPNSQGVIGMFVGTVVIMLVVLAAFVVSHLMLEEKQTRTMDVLLVSPASIAQVIAGKALAGAFYCLVAVVATLAFQWTAVTHWGVVALAVLVGVLFAVAGGLLLGVLFENPQQMGLWVGAPILLLLAAMMVGMLGVELPAGLATVIAWLPTTAIAKILQASFSGGATFAETLPDAGIVLGWALLLYAVVAWKVRALAQ